MIRKTAVRRGKRGTKGGIGPAAAAAALALGPAGPLPGARVYTPFAPQRVAVGPNAPLAYEEPEEQEQEPTEPEGAAAPEPGGAAAATVDADELIPVEVVPESDVSSLQSAPNHMKVNHIESESCFPQLEEDGSEDENDPVACLRESPVESDASNGDDIPKLGTSSDTTSSSSSSSLSTVKDKYDTDSTLPSFSTSEEEEGHQDHGVVLSLPPPPKNVPLTEHVKDLMRHNPEAIVHVNKDIKVN